MIIYIIDIYSEIWKYNHKKRFGAFQFHGGQYTFN